MNKKAIIIKDSKYGITDVLEVKTFVDLNQFKEYCLEAEQNRARKEELLNKEKEIYSGLISYLLKKEKFDHALFKIEIALYKGETTEEDYSKVKKAIEDSKEELEHKLRLLKEEAEKYGISI